MKSWITWTAHPSIHPRLRHSTSFHFGQRCLCQGTLQLCNDLALQEWFSLRNYLLKAMGVDTSGSICRQYMCMHTQLGHIFCECVLCAPAEIAASEPSRLDLVAFFQSIAFLFLCLRFQFFLFTLGLLFWCFLLLVFVFVPGLCFAANVLLVWCRLRWRFRWWLGCWSFLFRLLVVLLSLFPTLAFLPFLCLLLLVLSKTVWKCNYNFFRHPKRMQWIWDRL